MSVHAQARESQRRWSLDPNLSNQNSNSLGDQIGRKDESEERHRKRRGGVKEEEEEKVEKNCENEQVSVMDNIS